MTPIEFEDCFDQGLLDDDYFLFIQENADPNVRLITNGDALLAAFEEMYLFDEFREYIIARG